MIELKVSVMDGFEAWKRNVHDHSIEPDQQFISISIAMSVCIRWGLTSISYSQFHVRFYQFSKQYQSS